MYRGSAITAGLLIAALGLLGLSHEAAGQAGSGMVMLTDGTSLNNFDQAGNANWRIAERTIAADRGNGFLVTKQSYGDFRSGPSSGSMRTPTAASSSVATIHRIPAPRLATK